jgi:hypothetical protein
MANQAAPARLTPVPALDGAGLDSGRKALSERLPRPCLFPLAVFAATWVMTVASWSIANLVYGTHWTWSKYFWIWDSGFFEAGLITQVLAGGASAIGVWMLARHVYGHRVADRAILLYCGFFGATVLGWMYTEPLAIALAASR